ncbi:MAG: efflux RND transporter periplasmic adaptor subunit [Gemmatimonadota bacterium]|nr:MAG: efflux RND transporter periplasmic adaptor subunit [Gemmatimonadota bacterium]
MKWISGILGLSLTIAVAACAGEQGEQPAGMEPVDVVVTRSVASYGLVTAPGTVVAEEAAELATRTSGRIRRVHVDIGSSVSTADPLVTLDSEEIDARIRSAEAGAELARQWHERISSLAEDGAATAQELDDANARLEMAEATLREARAQRSYVILRAPFSGVVTARRADPGDLAVPGVPIVEMIGSGGLKIEADLPADLAGQLAAGDRIDVYRSETSQRYAAQVIRVVPAVERASRRFRIEAHFYADSTGLPAIPPGTFVRVELGGRAATTRWIPGDVVVNRGQLTGVFQVEGDELRLRWIRLGQRFGASVEMLAGPAAEALLVRDPASTFVDGQPVGNVQRVSWAPPFAELQTASTEEAR